MSNSPLVNYTKLSPNFTPREDTVKKITIHHVAGKITVEALGDIFFPAKRKGSSNYGIGYDGRIGMYVEEKNRAWTSGSPENDHQAITIEVSNSGGAPDWKVSENVLNKLVDLCVDICKRNGIAKLNYTGDKTGNLTRHNMFMATACPGPYLQSKFPWIAEQVNKRLNVAPSNQFLVKITADLLNIRKSASIWSLVSGKVKKNEVYTIIEVKGDWGRLKSGAGWINLKYTKRV